MQLADSTGPDHPAHLCRLIWACCSLTESMDTVVCVDEQNTQIRPLMQMLIWAFTVCIWNKGLFPPC